MDLQIFWRIGVAVGAPPDFPLSPRHLAAFLLLCRTALRRE
jgi:hypothetical protein